MLVANIVFVTSFDYISSWYDKMKTPLYISYNTLFVVLVTLASDTAIAQVTFENTYGTTGYDYANAVQQTSDNGYIMVGTTMGYDSTTFEDIYLVRTDSLGLVLWSKTYGGDSADAAYVVQITNDGGFIIVGETESFGAGDKDVYLIKTDSNGDTLWTKVYGRDSTDYAMSIRQTSDNGYILVGTTHSFGNGNGEMYVIRTDSIGDTLWTRAIGGDSTEYGFDVAQAWDGSFVVVGGSKSTGLGQIDAYLVKLSVSGGITWTQAYGDTLDDVLMSVKEAPSDSGYICVGYTNGFGLGKKDVYLLKVDRSGNFQFNRMMGDTTENFGSFVDNTSDGGYIIGGLTRDTSLIGGYNIQLIKITPTGDTSWTSSYGGADEEGSAGLSPRFIDETDDGGFVIAAMTMSYGFGSADMYLIKTDSNGSSGCNWRPLVRRTGIANGAAGSGGSILPGGSIVKSTKTKVTTVTTTKEEQCGCITLSKTITNTTCNGGSDGSITVSAYGGTTPYTYKWAGGETTTTISNLSAGTYTITVTDNASCTKTENITVGQPSVLTIKMDSVDISSNGAGDGQAISTASGSNGSYTYSWNTGSTTQSITSLSSGTYTVTVLDSKSCQVIGSITVNEPELLPQDRFEYTYGDTLLDHANAVQQTSDKGYIIVGTTSSFGTGFEDVYLVKTDSVGEVLWSKTYGGNLADAGSVVQITEDGGFIIVGYTESFGSGGRDVYLIKTNAVGDTVWTRAYGGDSLDYGVSVRQTKDKGYVLIGTTHSFGNGSGEMYVIKTDSLGDTLWTRAIGWTDTEYGFDIAEGYDGQFICAGATESRGAGKYDGLLVKLLSSGANTWSIAYGGTEDDMILSVKETPSDSGYICAGYTESFGKGNSDFYLLKVGWSNVLQWTKTYGDTGLDRASFVDITNDGGYIICGLTKEPSALKTYDIQLIRTNSNGDTTWTMNYGGSGEDGSPILTPRYIDQTTDSGFVIGGYTEISETAISDMYLIKTDKNGISGCNGRSVIPTVSSAFPLFLGVFASQFPGTLVKKTKTKLTSPATIKLERCGGGCPLSLISSVTNATCNDDSDGSITVSAFEGASPYSYKWATGDTVTTISSLIPGIYPVTVTDDTGCQIVDFISVGPSALSINFGATDVTCNGGSDGSVIATAGGGTSQYNYKWNNAVTVQSIINLSAATYTVTITDANNCIGNFSQVIAEPAVLNLKLDSTDNACNSIGTGSAIVTVSGGNGSDTYKWSTGATTQSITSIVDGTYIVTVTDLKSCQTIDSIVVAITEVLSSTLDSVNSTYASAMDGSATVTASGGYTPYTYSWNNGATTQTISSLLSAVYTCTVTDSKGCQYIDSIEVVDDPFSVTLSPTTDVTCNGAADGSVSATGKGGIGFYTYAWNTGATIQTISSLSGGNYTVTVQESGGTSIIQTVTINEPVVLSLELDSTENACNSIGTGSAIVTVSGGNGSDTYKWSTGATTQSISSIGLGTYTVTVTDSKGCQTVDSIVVTNTVILTSTLDTVNASTSSTNDGTATVTATGGYTPYTYSWSTGATTQTITSLAIGSYTSTVTDSKGCTYIDSVIIVMDSLTITFSPVTDVTCNGTLDGTVSATGKGGSGTYTYAWNTGATSQTIGSLSGGTYTITVKDFTGISIFKTVVINEPAVLSLNLDSTDNACISIGTGSATVTASGGNGTYTYDWSTGATTQMITSISSGTYIVTVTDSKSCQSVDSITVLQSTALSGNLDSIDLSSNGTGDGTATITVSGGNTPYTYSWSTGVTTQTITSLSGGTYTCTVVDSKGCQFIDSIFVVEPDTLSMNTYPVDVTCLGNSDGSASATALGGVAPLTYKWNTGETTQIINGVLAGTYTVTARDANDSIIVKTAVINQPSVLTIGYDSTDVTCNGAADGSATATG
ncbi:MAG: hypothetical protein COC01_01200, partial [Bacteroidetes bacterium]